MKEAKKERRETTHQEQRAFLEKKIRNKEWQPTTHKIGGKRAYYDSQKDLWYTEVKGEKHDFEVWKVSGKKAYHQGAIEPKNGSMYESAKHGIERFD